MASQIDQYDPIFKAAGAEWNVDPTVLKALALHESGGRVDAVGKSGEQGLMQLMPGTQRQLGVTAPFNAEQSIYGGAKYLAMGLDAEHDNPTAALRYYNGGPGWRTSGGDPKYPSYVGAQYVKLAKADTGTLTDATPAPPAATAHADAPDYNNAPAKAPAKPTAAPDGKVPDAYDAALKGKDASKPAAEPDPYTKALGTPAETASKEAGTAPEAVGDVGVSAEDYARATALPSGKPIASLEDLRDRVQQATTDAQRWFAPSPTSAAPPPAPSGAPPGPPMPEGLSGTISPGDVENFARKAAATGVGLAAMPANMLLNALVGIKQLGAGDATTWNPATQTYGVTPEGMMAGQLALGGGLRFSGVNPLVREPPSMLTQAGVTKPLPVTMNELRAAMNRVPPEPYGPPAPPSARPTVEAAAEPPLLSPGDHQWAGGMRDRLAEIQQENQDAGIPGSVGAAATPQQLAQLTPAQMKAYRAQAELGGDPQATRAWYGQVHLRAWLGADAGGIHGRPGGIAERVVYQGARSQHVRPSAEGEQSGARQFVRGRDGHPAAAAGSARQQEPGGGERRGGIRAGGASARYDAPTRVAQQAALRPAYPAVPVADESAGRATRRAVRCGW